MQPGKFQQKLTQKIKRLSDWLLQPYNGGDYYLKVIILEILVSLAALTNQLLIEIQWNGLLRTMGVVILDTGHHLTSHLTEKNKRRSKINGQIEGSSIMGSNNPKVQIHCVLRTTGPISVKIEEKSLQSFKMDL